MTSKALLPQFIEAKKIESKLTVNILVVTFGVALLVASSYITIPLPFTPVPLSLQTFAVLVIGSSFGLTRGSMTTAIYLLLGFVGMPFFAGGSSGVEVLLGSTGGYLIGFFSGYFISGLH